MDMQTSFGARGLIMSVFNSFVQQQISREQPLLAKHLGSKGSFSLMTKGATVGCDPYPELQLNQQLYLTQCFPKYRKDRSFL